MTGSPAARVAVAVAALVGGALVGVCSVLVHHDWWGLLLALAATGACLVAIAGGWWRRLPFAVGWDAAVLWLSVERSEGDYLIASDTSGYLLLGSGVVVLIAGVVGAVGPRPGSSGGTAINAGPGSSS